MSKILTFYIEKELVSLLKNNDKKAFNYLYDHYSKGLYGIILKIVKDRSKADDVMQDSFLKIWKNIGSYEPEKGSLFTWMLNVSRHTAIDSKRANMKFQYHISWDEVAELEFNQSVIVHPQYHTIDLKSSLKSLRAEREQVIDLVYLKGYTHQEASEHLNLPLGTVKSRVRVAMTELRYWFAVPVIPLKIA